MCAIRKEHQKKEQFLAFMNQKYKKNVLRFFVIN